MRSVAQGMRSKGLFELSQSFSDNVAALANSHRHIGHVTVANRLYFNCRKRAVRPRYSIDFRQVGVRIPRRYRRSPCSALTARRSGDCRDHMQRSDVGKTATATRLSIPTVIPFCARSTTAHLAIRKTEPSKEPQFWPLGRTKREFVLPNRSPSSSAP